MNIKIKNFFDTNTSTHSYVVWDAQTHDAVVIDPVLGYDQVTQKTFEATAQEVVQFVETNRLKVHLIIETHVHADHLSASQNLKKIWPHARLAINSNISIVQKNFAPILAMPSSFKTDGSQFDLLLSDQESFNAGSLSGLVIFTPGHTPACTSIKIGSYLFVGDTLFLPDVGTGRCDFPGGSAKTLYHSIHEKIYKLDPETIVCVGHDYPPQNRQVQFQCRLNEQLENNVHLKQTTTLEEFVTFREARDKTLAEPRLLRPSIKANIQAGVFNN
jgi:glyoxylase-like metal-dependent hydrolase (beta-lactamase superfamily II)